MDLRPFVRDVPDFPRQGVVFKDITPLLADPRALAESVRRLAGRVSKPEVVVAIESRGFVFGTGLALHWGVPLVPFQFYSVDDGTGQITVIGHSGRVPSTGTRVNVKGRVQELAAFGGQSLGLHLDEETRKIKY